MREMLFASTNVEKVHNLGPDWFGKDVRMGTVILQARRGPRDATNDHISCMVLAGKLRDRAIRGEVPLTQVESQRRRLIPTARSLDSPSFDIEVLRQVEDDRIIHRMMMQSVNLSDDNGLCKRARGEEINKAGASGYVRVASIPLRRVRRKRAVTTTGRSARPAGMC